MGPGPFLLYLPCNQIQTLCHTPSPSQNHTTPTAAISINQNLCLKTITKKIWHEVISPAGSSINNPWSPYHQVTLHEFQAFIDHNFPINQPSDTHISPYHEQSTKRLRQNLITRYPPLPIYVVPTLSETLTRRQRRLHHPIPQRQTGYRDQTRHHQQNV